MDLMNYFKELLNKGYSEEQAYDDIEKRYKGKIEEKRKNLE